MRIEFSRSLQELCDFSGKLTDIRDAVSFDSDRVPGSRRVGRFEVQQRDAFHGRPFERLAGAATGEQPYKFGPP